MDLLKEEKKLIENRQKALENLERKKKYLTGATISLKKAEREFKNAGRKLSAIREQIKMQGIESFDIPEVIAEPEPIEEESAD